MWSISKRLLFRQCLIYTPLSFKKDGFNNKSYFLPQIKQDFFKCYCLKIYHNLSTVPNSFSANDMNIHFCIILTLCPYMGPLSPYMDLYVPIWASMFLCGPVFHYISLCVLSNTWLVKPHTWLVKPPYMNGDKE